jgi:hypothetical protein
LFAAGQARRSALERHMAGLSESEIPRRPRLWMLSAGREVMLAFEMASKNELRGTKPHGHPVDPS